VEATFLSHGPEETEGLGQGVAELLAPGDVLALCGELGSGKTCFVRGMARGLEVEEALVASPSFTLVNEYPGRITLYHMDFYRLRDLEDLELIGFWEYLGQEAVVAVEWADRIPQAFPSDTLWVHFSLVGEREREISFRGEGEAGRRVVEGLLRKG